MKELFGSGENGLEQSPALKHYTAFLHRWACESKNHLLNDCAHIIQINSSLRVFQELGAALKHSSPSFSFAHQIVYLHRRVLKTEYDPARLHPIVSMLMRWLLCYFVASYDIFLNGRVNQGRVTICGRVLCQRRAEWSVFGHLQAIQRNRNSLLMFENIANVPLLDITKKAFIEGEPW